MTVFFLHSCVFTGRFGKTLPLFWKHNLSFGQACLKEVPALSSREVLGAAVIQGQGQRLRTETLLRRSHLCRVQWPGPRLQLFLLPLASPAGREFWPSGGPVQSSGLQEHRGLPSSRPHALWQVLKYSVTLYQTLPSSMTVSGRLTAGACAHTWGSEEG